MTHSFDRVSVAGILSGALDFIPDAPQVARGMLNMLRSSPDRAWSIGLLLEEQARRHPQRPALRFGERE